MAICLAFVPSILAIHNSLAGFLPVVISNDQAIFLPSQKVEAQVIPGGDKRQFLSGAVIGDLHDGLVGGLT